MEENSKVGLVHRFFPGTGSSYDFMVNLCTLGFDRWWKNKILERIPEGSMRILDQACGTGILTFRIAQKLPLCRIVGVDLTEEYLDIAKKKAGRLNLENVEFILGKAEEVVLRRQFDCITSSYLAKYAELGNLIRNANTMLRSGGVLIMHDFTYPPNHAFARLWEFYFRILQEAGKRKYPKWQAIFDGLPQLLRETTWTTEVIGILKRNAFSEISIKSLTFGTSAIVTAKKEQALLNIH